MALLTGIVLILVALVGLFLFADFGADDEEQLLANIEGDVEASNITLTHEGGDTFEPGEVEVVLTGDTAAEYSLGSDFKELSGSNSRLEPGDTWRNQVSDLILGEGRLLVIHEPTNTILLDNPYSVEAAEDGVTFLMTDWEDGPGSEPDNTDETTIYKGEEWNYSVRAQFPDGSTLSVDPANVSFDISDTSKLSPTDTGKLNATDSGDVTANVTVTRSGVDDFDEMDITILDSKPNLTLTNVTTGRPGSLSSNAAGVGTRDTGTSSQQVGTLANPIMEGEDVGVQVEVEATEPVEVTDTVSIDAPWAGTETITVTTNQSGTAVETTFETEETDNPVEDGWEDAGSYAVTAEVGESGAESMSDTVKVHGRAFYNVSFADTSLTVIDLLAGTLVGFDAQVAVENVGHVKGDPGTIDFAAVDDPGVIDFDPEEDIEDGLAPTPLGQKDEPGGRVTQTFTYPLSSLTGTLASILEMEANVSGVESDGVVKPLSLDETNYNVTVLGADPNPVGEGDEFDVEVKVGADSSAKDVDLGLDTGGLDGIKSKTGVPVNSTRNFTVSTSPGDAQATPYTIEATASVNTNDVGSDSVDVDVNAPAQFEITGISANRSTVNLDDDESFAVDYTVENTGGVTDTQFINFTVTDESGSTVYANKGSVEVELSPGESATGSSAGTLSPFAYTPQDGDQPRLTARVASDDDSASVDVDVPYNVSFTVTVPDFGESESDSTDMFAPGALSSASLGGGLQAGSMLYSGGSPAAGLYAAAPDDGATTEDNGTDRGGDGGDNDSSDRRGLEPETIGTQTHYDVPADPISEGMIFTRPAEPWQGVEYDAAPADPIFGSQDPITVDVSGLDRVGVELEGAGGGGGQDNGAGGFPGGAGGYIDALIDVSEFSSLTVYVGEGGKQGDVGDGGWGYEDGGAGSQAGCGLLSSCGGGGGGGSTAIVAGDGTWIMTAAGGGGGLAKNDDNELAFGGGGGGGGGNKGIGRKGNNGENGENLKTEGKPGGDGGHRNKGVDGEDGDVAYDSSYVIETKAEKKGGAFNSGPEASDGGDGRAFVYSVPQYVDVSNTDFIKVALNGPGGGAGGPIIAGAPEYGRGGDGGNVTAVIDVSEFEKLQVFVGEGGEGAQQIPTEVGQSNYMTAFRPVSGGDPSDAYEGHGGFGGHDGGHGGIDAGGDFIDGDVAVKGGGGGGSTTIRAVGGSTDVTLVEVGGGGGGSRDRTGFVGGLACFVGGGNCGYGGGGGAPGGIGGNSEDTSEDNGNLNGESGGGFSTAGGDGADWKTSNSMIGEEGSFDVNTQYVQVLSSNDGGGGDGGLPGNSKPGNKGDDGKIEILETFSTPSPDGQIDLSSTNKEYLRLELDGSGGGGGYNNRGGDGGRLEVRLNVTELRNTFGNILYYWEGEGGTYDSGNGGTGGTGLLPGGDGGSWAGGGGGSTEVRGESSLTGNLVAAADAGGGGGDSLGVGSGGGGAAGGVGGGTSAEDAYERPGAPGQGGDGGSDDQSGDTGGYVIDPSADYVETVLVGQSGGADTGGGEAANGDDGNVTYEFVNGTGSTLTNLDIAGQGNDASIIVQNNTDVSVDVTNDGDIEGDFTVSLEVSPTDDTTVVYQDDKNVLDLAPSATQTVTFAGVTGALNPDEYDVNVSTSGDSLSGALNVTIDPANFVLTLTNVPDKIEEGESLTIGYEIENTGSYDGTADKVQLNIDGSGNRPDKIIGPVTVPAGDVTTGTIVFQDTETIQSLADAGIVTVVESDADNETEARPPVVAP